MNDSMKELVSECERERERERESLQHYISHTKGRLGKRKPPKAKTIGNSPKKQNKQRHIPKTIKNHWEFPKKTKKQSFWGNGES